MSEKNLEISEKIKIEGLLKEVFLASITSGLNIGQSMNNVREFDSELSSGDQINKYSGIRQIEILKGKKIKDSSRFDVNKKLESGATPQEIAATKFDIFE